MLLTIERIHNFTRETANWNRNLSVAIGGKTW